MKSLLSAALLALAATVPAGAATINAQPNGPASAFVSAFSIQFDDANGDGLFEIGELTGFSGMTSSGFGAATWTLLRGVPEIAGLTKLSLLPGTPLLSQTHWAFGIAGEPGALFASDAGNWTYTGDTPAPVPLPAGLPLLAAGLAALLAARRART